MRKRKSKAKAPEGTKESPRQSKSSVIEPPAEGVSGVLSPLPPQARTPSDIDSLLNETKARVNSIYRDVLDRIGEQFHFKARPSKGEIFSSPMVVFLGNHSSGKSTFINYLLDESDLQTTGQAPMDDGFTLICHGNSRDEQLGPAIVNNTKLPYTSLANIGDQFVEHLKMKFLPHPLLKQVTLIDSPGMIDSVGEGRGYDFAEAVRWFAERADYVLFFFDGEKPGTTGEALKIFTESLTGIDHKLLILMNKVDTFKNIGDFVRTYGTLCWNLAKVIPYKDMPFIYTTFAPVDSVSGKPITKPRPHAVTADAASPSLPPPQSPSYRSWSLSEFEQATEKVVKKVSSAPSRHADNMVTELKRYIEHLLLHAQVAGTARNRQWWLRVKCWFGLLFFTIFTAFLLFQFNVSPGQGLRGGSTLEIVQDILLPLMGSLFVLLAGACFFVPHLLAKAEKEALANLLTIFETVYAKELMGSSEDYYRGLWTVVHPTTKFTIEKFGLLSFPTLTRKQHAQLHYIMTNEVEHMLDRVHTTLQL